MRLFHRSLAVMALATPTAATACTLCRSPAARLVRDRVLDVASIATFAEVALPVVLMAAVLGVSMRARGR